mgnify:CR=1 FL=1
MRLAILALCLCAAACGVEQPVIGDYEHKGDPMAETRRLYPSGVIHYTSATFTPGDSAQIRWSGLVVEVSHERILVCEQQSIETGAAIAPRPILWERVIPGQAWFEINDTPIERPEEVHDDNPNP